MDESKIIDTFDTYQGGAGVDDEGHPLDEPGMQILTNGGAAIGPIRPIGTATRIAGTIGPDIDGPAMEAAVVADADDSRR